MLQNLNDTDSNQLTEDRSELDLRKLSHDIRTSVHGLIGYVEILKQETASSANPMQKELLARIDSYSHQVIDLVYDLLDKFEE